MRLITSQGIVFLLFIAIIFIFVCSPRLVLGQQNVPAILAADAPSPFPVGSAAADSTEMSARIVRPASLTYPPASSINPELSAAHVLAKPNSAVQTSVFQNNTKATTSMPKSLAAGLLVIQNRSLYTNSSEPDPFDSALVYRVPDKLQWLDRQPAFQAASIKIHTSRLERAMAAARDVQRNSENATTVVTDRKWELQQPRPYGPMPPATPTKSNKLFYSSIGL